MTKLHFNYKDVFRALRIGFSAKKVWIASVGLFVGFAGYAALTYLAHLVAGSDLATVWERFRLLPFADPLYFPFPWYSWVISALGGLFFVCSALVAGTAVSKVAYEQLRGDEFFESREAYRFAFRHLSSVLGSPVLLAGFIVLVGLLGLLTSLIGAIPYFGELWLGLFAVPAFIASLFIVYLLLVMLVSLLLGPSIVGTTRNDTFDTVFEAFSSVNEQPARLTLYLATVFVLSRVGAGLLALASGFAWRIAHAILRIVPGLRFDAVMANAGYCCTVTLPEWWPALLRLEHGYVTELLALPDTYAYTSLNWAGNIASGLVGAAFYVTLLLVIAFGCSVWFSGNTLVFTVLAYKKDDKNLLELPEDEADLLEPVVDVPGKPTDSPEPSPAAGEPGAQPPPTGTTGTENEKE